MEPQGPCPRGVGLRANSLQADSHRKSLGEGELSAAINVTSYLLASGHMTSVDQHLGWPQRGVKAASRQSKCSLE